MASLELGTRQHESASVADTASDDVTQRSSSKDYNPAPDQRDMRRLGKKQELKVSRIDLIDAIPSLPLQRRFRFFSIVGYVIVLGLTWEFSLVVGAFSLSNGGPAGAIWLTFFVCCGMVFVMLSMVRTHSSTVVSVLDC
jgi:choline transport protein